MSLVEMAEIGIEASDVIRLILQFLKESNLPLSFDALSKETNISLNTVDSISEFTNNIINGNWDVVLRSLSTLNVNPRKLIDLYEQIIFELLELKELSAARLLLRQSEPMNLLKDLFPERYLHLEHFISRTYFDEKEVYAAGNTKEKRRKAIANALSDEVTTVSPSRLLSLLGQSVKWQYSQGLIPPESQFDLFRGIAKNTQNEDDMPVAECFNTIKFPKKNHPEAVAFSPNGQYLVTGSVDGLIEVWNYMTGKLRKDFKYQAEDNFMMTDAPILSLSFSRDSETLASGDQSGKIKVWKLQTGMCVRRFLNAHSSGGSGGLGGVTSCVFSKDGTNVLSGGFDCLVRIHGIKSGKMLKEFKGHSSFVNDVLYSYDGMRVISGSSDGTVKIWDAKSTSCLHSLSLVSGKLGATNSLSNAMGITNTAGVAPTVNKILQCNGLGNEEDLIVCSKETWCYKINIKGQLLKTYTLPPPPKAVKNAVALQPAFTTAVMSAKGEYVYCVDESSTLWCFKNDGTSNVDSAVGSSEGLKLRDVDIIGITHHPYSNIVVVYGDDGHVKLYRP
ncbi:Serine/threonine-protein kinase smu1 [Nowakowskiella sp. JEL0407]|nr:Serine/threonine-protein kinase smu1 [Nowakowskiella sp. JEL0407]